MPGFRISDRNVGRHAGSPEMVDHEKMILSGGRVIVNNIVGLRTRARSLHQWMTTGNLPWSGAAAQWLVCSVQW